MARDTILFDINETVLDLASLGPRFAEAFGDAGLTATWFATLLHASTVAALTGVGTTFADLAGDALERLAALRKVALSDNQRAKILGGFASLPPHADVPPALERLHAAGYRAIAFTNSSDDLVTRQLAHAGLIGTFDGVLTVEPTGSFKPDARVYAYAAECLERPIGALRLIAAHDWDTHGALTAGMDAAYVDRTGAPYHPRYSRPDVFGSTMTGVVEAIIAADAAAA